jgi:hypothetical protein
MATRNLERLLVTAKNGLLNNNVNKTNVMDNLNNRNVMFYGGGYNQFASLHPSPRVANH